MTDAVIHQYLGRVESPVLRHSHDQILIQTVNGVVTGMILALVASGLTLIFGIMDVVNFAHGELFMLGAYVGVVMYGRDRRFLARARRRDTDRSRYSARHSYRRRCARCSAAIR